MLKYLCIVCFALLSWSIKTYGQEISILSYNVNDQGRVLMEVASTTDHYYLLQVRTHLDSAFSQYTSMTFGEEETTTITEPLEAYSQEHYRVLEFSTDSPGDADGDGVDDIAEFNDMPARSPFNAADIISTEHGMNAIRHEQDFHSISTNLNNTPWIEYLDEMEYTKFIIVDFFSTHPKLYFVNCNTYPLHEDFAAYLGIDQTASSIRKGQIMYIPTALSSNGSLGTYAFSFSSNLIEEFSVVQRTHELIAANMPFLNNNLAYFITPEDEELYAEQTDDYASSRVQVVFESDAYAGIDYWGLNQGEGYGYLHLMNADDVPNPYDIAVYEHIPNALPHVGGIITTAFQTPLSHINLRAIQDQIPNAFIRNALDMEEITDLLGHYVYFKAGPSQFEIREASLAEVNAWYEDQRPDETQYPVNNMSYKSILPLDSIYFEMYDGFGAKVANVATMRSFGFEEGTIPNGFGIPFYYYQEFMIYNHFFDQVDEMLADETFMTDRAARDEQLMEFREEIENAFMPQWMLDSLTNLQFAFPEGTSIRCRSSTNNEDLPEFSGAGLYDSKTHHPDEGHIAKTIKEIFASLWNLRAFDEREFYRVDHYSSSMGVLCHHNFEGELVNGVGVTADPVYGTTSTFYLNSQLGEELITNPEGSLPEELLMKRTDETDVDYAVIQYSNLIDEDTLLIDDGNLYILREYMKVIHDRFEQLYHAEYNATFSMDVEYKITSDGRIAIKQARPWVGYVPKLSYVPQFDERGLTLFPNPSRSEIRIGCSECSFCQLRIFDLSGRIVWKQDADFSNSTLVIIDIQALPDGVYTITGFNSSQNGAIIKFVKY